MGIKEWDNWNCWCYLLLILQILAQRYDATLHLNKKFHVFGIFLELNFTLSAQKSTLLVGYFELNPTQQFILTNWILLAYLYGKNLWIYRLLDDQGLYIITVMTWRLLTCWSNFKVINSHKIIKIEEQTQASLTFDIYDDLHHAKLLGSYKWS